MAKIHGTLLDDRLRGTSFGDDIEGRAGDDKIWGFGGNDDIEGNSGNDKLYGGAGNDDIEGGTGNDVLDGGRGRNELEGGPGADTFVFRFGITKIDDFDPGKDLIRIDDALGADNFQELKTFARIDGEDLVFDFGNHELRLDDTKLSDLRASDFDFF
jgi:Ca2+-binding RTX toxin-like protein